ncbi:MAG: site-specific integrase [Fuerstiella sp.]|nr:site-specific integrase [Fuerstiella sp.]
MHSTNAQVNVIVVDRGRKSLYLRYTDPVTEKRVEKSAKTSSRRQAQKLAGQWQQEIEAGISKPNTKLTWDEFRQAYEDLHASGLAKETRDKIQSVLNSFERSVKARRLASITGEHVAQWQRSMRTAGCSEHTIASYSAHLKAAFNWTQTIYTGLNLPPVSKPQRAFTGDAMKGRPITTEEFERMIGQIKEPYMREVQHAGWKHLLIGLWWSGLRLEESTNLYWDRLDRISIDLSSGRPLLRIPAAMEKGNKDRLYPVATEFAEMILAVPESERTGPFFTVRTKTGKPYSRSRHAIGKIISELGRRAGIITNVNAQGKELTASAHDLRRSFGERWSRRVEAQWLQKMMRHSSIQTTLRYYTSRNADEAAAHIDAAFQRAVQDSSTDPQMKPRGDTSGDTTSKAAVLNSWAV